MSQAPGADAPSPITNLAELQAHLQTALELELTTIPPYLVAICTIRPDTNEGALSRINKVMMEEMLHMALAANVLNAVGGRPVLADARIVPTFPATLPVGRGTPVIVDLRRFSPEAVETFLAIEYPRHPTPEVAAVAMRGAPAAFLAGPGEFAAAVRSGEIYASIGDFYEAIRVGLDRLETEARAIGATIFTGDLARQLPPEAYSRGGGGGQLYTVTDLASAQAAIKEIVDQGEGYGDTIGDGDDVTSQGEAEVAHYYRFNEIAVGRQYGTGDKPDDAPSGDCMPRDFSEAGVLPMIANPTPEQYADQALIDKSNDFDIIYSDLLRGLHDAFDGNPSAIDGAIGSMFGLVEKAVDLINQPIAGEEGNAGPCFRFVPA